MRLVILLLLLSAPALAANKAPEVRELTFDVDEDGALKSEIRANDDDHDSLTFSLTKPPKNGEMTLQPSGKFTYKPRANFHGKDEFVFEVTDGKAKVSKKGIIAVSAVNDPPTPGPAVEVVGQEDRQVKGQVTGSDIDGDKLSFTVGDEPATGEVVVDGRTGKFVYTPRENENGKVKFTIKMNDTYVDVAVPVTVTLEPTNDPPTASDDNAKGSEDDVLKGKLVANDIDKDALTFTLADAPRHGKVEIDPKGTFAFTPAKDWHGDDGFSFMVSDGKASAKARMALEIVGVNDAPSATKADFEANEDTPLKGKLIAKDPDGDEVYFSVKIDPAHGEVDLDRSTGAFTYSPNDNFHGADKFTFEAGDIGGAVAAMVNIVVKPVNDTPAAANDAVESDEDKPVTGKLKAEDVDKEVLTYAVSKAPRNGQVEVKSDGVFKFTPNPNFNGEDSFQFEVTDGKSKSQGTMTLKVKPVNDQPVTADVKLSTNEESQVKGTITGTDIDRDRLTFLVSKPPKKGEVVVDDRKGTLVYLPNVNENGEDTFSVEVSDGAGGAVESKVSVTINPVNDAPVAAAHENKGDEDQPIKGKVSGSDVDKDVLRFSVAAQPKHGRVEIDSGSGAYTYTPNAHFNGADEFRFEVADEKLRSQAAVKLAVAPVNDAPDVKNVSLSTSEDKAVGGSVPASDIDKDKLTWSAGKAAAKGKVVVEEGSGKITYTPNLNENGEDTFTVIVADGNAKSEATVTVAIAPVNDAPIADAHANKGKEDEPIKGKLTGSDVDKDTLVFTAATKPRSGTIELDSGSGSYTYTPSTHFNGEDGFRLEVSDGKLKAQADVKLTVIAVNDAPEPKELVLSTAEDRDVAGKLVASDVDRDVLTYRLKKAPNKGTAFVDDASGAVRYVPARDQVEKAAFVVEVTDGFATVETNVTVDVAAVPDIPLIELRPIETAEDEAVSVKLGALDADGEPVMFSVVTQSRLGKAEIDADRATLRFTPAADAHGEDIIVVEASDGKNKPRASIPVRVAAKNDPPTIDEAKAEILEETSAEIPLMVRDKDGDPVKVALGDKIQNADVRLTSGLLVVSPKKDYAGIIEFAVVPSDPAGKGAPAKVTVTVKNVNDAPTVKDAAVKAEPGKAVSGTVEASDADAGDELTFTVAVPPKQGSVVVDDAKTGKFTYTAAAGAKGDDSFRIRVKDKAGASVSATVRVAIIEAKTKPVATR